VPPGLDPNADTSGSSYVVFGKASGFGAKLNLADLDGSNGFRLDGTVTSEWSGISVSNAGDVNSDGFDDVIIGADGFGASPNGNFSGSSYVVFGKASGFSAKLDLSDLDGSNGFRLDGVAVQDGVGNSVSSAGDINGDGFDDLIVGARGINQLTGASYVVFGHSDFGGVKVIQGTPGKDQLAGTSAAEIFQADVGKDRMLGHGGADQFFGDAGNDYIRVSDLDFKSVDGGIGKDTLAMGGSGWNLDLTSVRGKISGIEAISLFGTGDNILTLTAQSMCSICPISPISCESTVMQGIVSLD